MSRSISYPRVVSSTLAVIVGAWIAAFAGLVQCQGAQHADLVAIAQSVPASWVPTGSLNGMRSAHTATLLQSGKVLVAGGLDINGDLRTAELYDPASGRWTLTGSMITRHAYHTATLLPSGEVLVAGGGSILAGGTNGAELYDPVTGTWTSTGNLVAARHSHTATLLPSGKVLVVGGYNLDNVKTAELYDPAEGTWTPTGSSLITARYGHTATLLQDGSVLIAGGSNDGALFTTLGDAELYDPVTGRWSAASTMIGRIFHTATLLPDGRVLVAGGYSGVSGCCAGLSSAELFDPTTRTWSGTGNFMRGRNRHTATLLPTGEVLVAGGEGYDSTNPFFKTGDLDSAEIYDPTTGMWSTTASLGTARRNHTATLFPDGRVLVAGGDSDSDDLPYFNSAELFTRSAPSGSVGPVMTGAWYDPAQSGHGIFLEILPNNSAFLGWFTFDPAGTQQVWFGGVGTYSGNSITFNAVDMPTGGRWIPNFDPTKIVHNAWGTLTLTFTDLDHGRADFNSTLGYGSGSMTLVRLTRVLPLARDVTIGSPTAVAADSAGNVYFDSPKGVVFKLDSQGVLTRAAGSGASGFAGDGGLATQALLNFPNPYPEMIADPIDWSEFAAGLAVDAAGNLFIADSYNHRIRKVDQKGVITTVAGDGSKNQSGDGGLATAAHVGWPMGVAVDAGGNLYVSEWNALRKVTPDGYITTLLGNNCAGSTATFGVCVPFGIAVRSTDDVYVVDGGCGIQELKPDGSAVIVAGISVRGEVIGSDPCGFSGDGGPATSATLNMPYGVATDNWGNLYIADTGNNRVRKIDASGTISTFAGNGFNGFAGDRGKATDAGLSRPHGVAVDAVGNVYIADTGNHRIRKVSPEGIITTIAGNGIDILSGAYWLVGTGLSGSWYDPAQNGHGIFLQILPDYTVFLGWFTFNPAGTQQAWFGGVSGYDFGDTAITIPFVDQPTGGRWIPNFNPSQIVHNPWGSMTLTFTDCNHGRVDFNSTSGYGTGSMNLVRLTQPAGTSCP